MAGFCAFRRTTGILMFALCMMMAMMAMMGYNSQRFLLDSTKTMERKELQNASECFLEKTVSQSSSSADTYQTLLDTSNDMKNYWFYFRSMAKQQSPSSIKTIDDGYAAVNARSADLMEKTSVDRKHQLNSMAKFVRKEIEMLQNPPDCNQARLLVQEIETLKGHGLACTAHIVVVGLIQAFMHNRTFVLRSENWAYAKEGWEYAYLPLGKCSFEGNVKGLPPNFGNEGKDSRIMKAGWDFAGWAQWRIPREFEEILKKMHGHPYAWWIAQFTAYVTRLQPSMEKKIDDLASEIGFTPAAVGVQIRWGDKLGTEATKREADYYMIFVEQWFQQLEIRGKPADRTVYLATEHEEAWKQLQEKYPKYKFIGNLRSTEAKGRPESRYNHDGLDNVLIDIFMLSRCNYLVCGTSSHVCRFAYELMMNTNDDASTKFQSIDVLYRMRTLQPQPWFAVMDHDPTGSGEIELKKGDQLWVSMDPLLLLNDGFHHGKNTRTGKSGKFPAFKVREKILTYSMPAFHEPWKPAVIEL